MMPERRCEGENMEAIILDYSGNQQWKLLVLKVCWVLRVNICTSEICFSDFILVEEGIEK